MWFFTEEEKELQQVCRRFAKNELAPYAVEHDEKETFNIKAFRKMGELGLLGITADEEYGGAALGCTAAAIVMEEFGKYCPSTTLSYLAHSILCVNNIQKNASPEQKKKFLPALVSGEYIGCMGMSEPDFGSDIIGMQTKAQKKKNHYLLNGSKTWITNAKYADIAYVYARTGKEERDISTFIVDKKIEGFSTGKSIQKMGMRGSPTGELVFENAKVPIENRVGKEGDSVYHMMQNLEIERITLAGISLGIANACVEHCVKYVQERKQFGKAIGNFQMVQKMVAEMSAETQMIRSFLYTTAKMYDQKKTDHTIAASVKLLIPKLVTKIALDAIQLHGGNGYGREFPLERLMRDNKLMEIGGGTNEVMVMIIAKNLLKECLDEGP